MGILPTCIAICVFCSPFLIKLHNDSRQRLATAEEFHQHRERILARIAEAAASYDFPALQQIDQKYTSSVADPEYRQAISTSLSSVIAHDRQMELTVSKFLDLARHREESSIARELLGPETPTIASTHRWVSHSR